MQRVITYIDGFNLYFGLRDKGWRRFFWLDIQKLSINLLKPQQQLVFTKYFTARVSQSDTKRRRQQTYLEALETLSDFKIFYGKYQLNPRTCRNCGFQDNIPNEKMTDVNIAVELLADAFQNRYDTAIIISADSDLTGPVERVRQLFPGKQVVVAFPPKRSSLELKNVASACFTIGRTKFKRSQFPEQVTKPDGYTLVRPARWK